MTNFKEYLSFLTGAVTVLLSLIIFRDEAKLIKLNVLGFDTTLLWLGLPLIVFLITSFYLGALALLSQSFSFNKLSTASRFFEVSSFVIAVIGLIFYPAAITLTLLAGRAVKSLSNLPVVLSLTIFALTLLALSLFVFMKRWGLYKIKQEASNQVSYSQINADYKAKLKDSTISFGIDLIQAYQNVRDRLLASVLRTDFASLTDTNLSATAMALYDSAMLSSRGLNYAREAQSLYETLYYSTSRVPSLSENRRLLRLLNQVDYELERASKPGNKE